MFHFEEFWPNRCMCKADHEHQDHNEDTEHYGSARRGDQDSEEIDEVQESISFSFDKSSLSEHVLIFSSWKIKTDA